MDGEGKEKKEIRRPMNAFLIFCKRHRSVVRQKHPDMDNRSITRLLGDLWANLGEEKNTYINLAKQYKDAFLKANPNYRWHSSDKFLNNSGKLLTKTINPWTMKNNGGDILQEGCITPGKLAEFDKMGGLNLLLMADKETSHERSNSTSSGMSSASHKASCSTAQQPVKCVLNASTANNALLQLAEMCSSELNSPSIINSNQATSSGGLLHRPSSTTSIVSFLTPKTSISISSAPYHQPMPPPKKRARHWSLTELDGVTDSHSYKIDKVDDADSGTDLSPLNLSMHSQKLAPLPPLESYVNYSDVEHFKSGSPRRRLSSSATESIPSPLPSYMDGSESPVFSDSLHSEKESFLSEGKIFEQLSCDGEKLRNYEQNSGAVKLETQYLSKAHSFYTLNAVRARDLVHHVEPVRFENSDPPKVTTVKLEIPDTYNWGECVSGKMSGTLVAQMCAKINHGVLGQPPVKAEIDNGHCKLEPLKHFAPTMPAYNSLINLIPDNGLTQENLKVKSENLTENNTSAQGREVSEQSPKAATQNSSSNEVKLKKKWVERMLVETKLNEETNQQANNNKSPALATYQAGGDKNDVHGRMEHSIHLVGPQHKPVQTAQRQLKPVQSSSSGGTISQPVSFSASSHPKLMMQLSQNQASHSYQPGQIWQQKFCSEGQGNELRDNISETVKENAPNTDLPPDEIKLKQELILKPITACGQKIYDHILQHISRSDFSGERAPVNIQPPIPMSSIMSFLNHKADPISKEDTKEDKIYTSQENNRKPMTASSLVEKVVREVCGSPSNKDGCSSCRKSEPCMSPCSSLDKKNLTSPPSSVMTDNKDANGDMMEENKNQKFCKPTNPISSQEEDASSKWPAPAVDNVDQSDHEDTSVPQLRKSRRANRGQKYQELIKEGFIQPSRERLAARNVERNGRSFGTREEFEKLESKRILKRSASEKDPVLNESVSIKLGSLSPSSDSALPTSDESQLKTGGFDLEKEIESLPVCSLEQMEKRKSSRRRFESESQINSAKTVSESESGSPVTQVKMSETVGTVHFQAGLKRKVHCIETERTSFSANKKENAEVPPDNNKSTLSSAAAKGCLERKLDTDVATSALLKLSSIMSVDSNRTAKKGLSSQDCLGNNKKKEGAPCIKPFSSTKTQKKFCLSAAHINTPRQPKTMASLPLKSKNCHVLHKSNDFKVASFDAKPGHVVLASSRPASVCSRFVNADKNNCDAKLQLISSIQPTNKGDKNVIISSLKVSPNHLSQKGVCADYKLASHEGQAVRLLSTLTGYCDAEKNQGGGEKWGAVKRGHLSSPPVESVLGRMSNSSILKMHDSAHFSAAFPQTSSSDSLLHKNVLDVPCTSGTTATVVIALPSHVIGNQMAVHPHTGAGHLSESDKCVLAGAERDGHTYMLVSSGSCFSLSAPVTTSSASSSSSLFTVAPSVISLPNSPSASVKEMVSYSVIGSGSVGEAGSPHMIGSPHLPESPSVAIVQS
ncbi:hypothetical protein Btru_064434 [Bulinus truncatus]|nr:hypothetical protein Btru_064434 [Bulinus truncatus]